MAMSRPTQMVPTWMKKSAQGWGDWCGAWTSIMQTDLFQYRLVSGGVVIEGLVRTFRRKAGVCAGFVDVPLRGAVELGVLEGPAVVVLHGEEGDHLPPIGSGAEAGLAADDREGVAVHRLTGDGELEVVDLRGDVCGREPGDIWRLGEVDGALGERFDQRLVLLPGVVEVGV